MKDGNGKDGSPAIPALAVLLAFFILYYSFGAMLARTPAFTEFDNLFGIDTPRVVGDMTCLDCDHYRTKVHPLYVLFVNPVGRLLSGVVQSNVVAALWMNSFFGALAVSLGFVFFRRYGKSLIESVVLTCLFGLSAGQFILSIIPDTASLATCSLLVTYVLFLVSLKKGRSSFPAWVLAGLFSLGITTTNFVQTLVCFAALNVAIPGERRVRRASLATLKLLSLVIVLAAALSLLQKWIYPSSTIFFLPGAYGEDMRYAGALVFRDPLKVLGQLMKHIFLVNVVAPSPAVFHSPGRTLPAITFGTLWSFGGAGWTAVTAWGAMLVAGVAGTIREKRHATLFAGFLACLAFNVVLHSFYGVGESGSIEYFLYTGNFSFIVLCVLANASFSSNRYTVTALIVLAALMGLNNMRVIMEIISIYR